MNYNTVLYQQWLDKCRGVLIEMETKNITTRASSWTTIVNDETKRLNMCFDQVSTNTVYDYSVRDPLKYLTFLSEWNGIKTRSVASRPSSYEEFEAKAKNWLNGRRAPNYGNTLFPDMIKSADEFVQHTAHLLFGDRERDNNDNDTSLSMATQYHKTLMFMLLYKLCTERIAVHQSWKKTMLLCENSVKNMHSNTAKLLQKYAIHDYSDNDLKSFPGSLARAAPFFSEQHNRYLSLLVDNYKQLRASDSTTTTDLKPIISVPMPPQVRSAQSYNHVNGVPPPLPRVPTGDGEAGRTTTNAAASNPCVAIKVSDYTAIMHRLAELERKHSEQASQISQLSSKCVALQSHMDYSSNVPPSLPVPSISTISGGTVTEYTGDRKTDAGDQKSLCLLSSSPSTSQCPSTPQCTPQCPSCQSRSTYHSAQPQLQQLQPVALANCNYNFASILSQPIQASFGAPRYAPLLPNMTDTTHMANNTVPIMPRPVPQLQPSHIAPFAVSSNNHGNSNSNNNGNVDNCNPNLLFNAVHAPTASFDYSGLRLQVPFSMFASPKSNLTQADNKPPPQDEAMTPTDCAMHFMTTSVPNAGLLNQSSYFADSNHSLMLDQGGETPNANNCKLFTFPPHFNS